PAPGWPDAQGRPHVRRGRWLSDTPERPEQEEVLASPGLRLVDRPEDSGARRLRHILVALPVRVPQREQPGHPWLHRGLELHCEHERRPDSLYGLLDREPVPTRPLAAERQQSRHPDWRRRNGGVRRPVPEVTLCPAVFVRLP